MCFCFVEQKYNDHRALSFASVKSRQDSTKYSIIIIPLCVSFQEAITSTVAAAKKVSQYLFWRTKVLNFDYLVHIIQNSKLSLSCLTTLLPLTFLNKFRNRIEVCKNPVQIISSYAQYINSDI